MINFILTLCVLIECWHMFYYGIYFDKFAKIGKVINWAVQYRNMHKHFLTFAREYIKEENKELRSAAGGVKSSIVQILDQIEMMGSTQSVTSKILGLLEEKQIYMFLAQQAVEIIYYVCLFILFIVLPIECVALLIIIPLLSWVQSKYNKDNDVAIHIFDSMVCIGIYVLISSIV